MNRLAGMLGPLLVALAFSPPAPAHQQSLSYGHWQAAGDELQAVLRHSALDLTRARLHPQQADFETRVSDWLAGRVSVQRGGAPCTLTAAGSRHNVDDGWVRSRLSWTCPATGAWELNVDGLFDQVPDHVHTARFQSADEAPRTRVLTDHQRRWRISQTPGPPASVTGFMRLGIDHILTGWDHLCFLLALLLLFPRLPELALLVTGFTLAHSLTLAATVLGYVAPPGAAVEAVIALSILLLCLENAWRDRRGVWLWPLLALLTLGGLFSPTLPAGLVLGLALFAFSYFALQARATTGAPLRLAITFAFGLFHGFGFAGILAEMNLPQAGRLPALLGFNIGVELGQLAVVLPLWALLQLLRRRLPPLAPVLNGGAAGLASYWLVLRAVA